MERGTKKQCHENMVSRNQKGYLSRPVFYDDSENTCFCYSRRLLPRPIPSASLSPSVTSPLSWASLLFFLQIPTLKKNKTKKMCCLNWKNQKDWLKHFKQTSSSVLKNIWIVDSARTVNEYWFLDSGYKSSLSTMHFRLQNVSGFGEGPR